jgi:hypothetical protein
MKLTCSLLALASSQLVAAVPTAAANVTGESDETMLNTLSQG